MTHRLDKERAAVLRTLARYMVAQSWVNRAAVTALPDARGIAMPLASLEVPPTSIVGALKQASASTSKRIHEPNAPMPRTERSEATEYEFTHIVAFPRYRYRSDYVLRPRSSHAPVPGPKTDQ